MDVVYRDAPKQMKALTDIHASLRIFARASRPQGASGSDTYEKAATLGSRIMSGNYLSRKWVASKTGYNILKGIQTDKVNAVLTDALLNPETAERIMDLTRKAASSRYKVPKHKIDEMSKYVFDDVYQQILQRRKAAVGITAGATSATANSTFLEERGE
jgi:hypothetical protein